MSQRESLPDQSGTAPMVTLAHFERTVAYAQSERDEARQECIRLRGQIAAAVRPLARIAEPGGAEPLTAGQARVVVADALRLLLSDSATPDEESK